MAMPTGLGTQLQKDINDLIALMYEDVTPDSEDCKSFWPSIRVALITFPT